MPPGPLERLQIPVAGMTCQACAHTIQKALARVPGVSEVHVNFGSRSATLMRDPGRAGGATIAAAIREAGYSAPENIDDPKARGHAEFREQADAREQSRLARDAVIATLFGLPVVFAHGLALDPKLALALSLPVQFVAGARTLSSGLRALARGAPDMHSLIAIGSLSAWAAAAHGILFGGHASAHGELHAAVLIVAFVLWGRWMEGSVRRRSGDDMRSLARLAPARARVLRRGVEVELDLEQVRVGNLVLVRPGERIPVDGEVMDGASFVDESTWSGESAPVEKLAGSRVRAGSINGDGGLSIRASAVGIDSSLGRVTEAVRQAQGSRAPIQELADRISARFVPAVLGLAALTFLVWWWLDGHTDGATAHAVAVLVAACPCALGLATPAAVIAAVGRGAREGILVRDAAALQRLADIHQVVFDKTGTLTVGKPSLVAIESVDPDAADRDLALAASVEAQSEQPLGKALHQRALERGLALRRVDGFRALPGSGVEARVDGRLVQVLSRRAALERASDPSLVERLLADALGRGETTAVLVVDGQARAAFAFADPVREESKQAMRDLRTQGVDILIFSGDNPAAVERVARELEIERWRGAMEPVDKAEAVAELARVHRHAAMVGDGVNDAPALARADVGIAMGGGADVALAAADCAILRDDPRRVATAIALGRRTLHTIRINLAWAFGYNLIALPAAAGVLEPLFGWSPPPAWAAAAMAGSSVAVLVHSLLLRRVDLRPRQHGRW